MNLRVRSLLLSLAFAAMAVTGGAQEVADRDLLTRPLPIRDQFLLNNGFYFFVPESAFVLSHRGWSAEVRFDDSNTFATSRMLGNTLEAGMGRSRAADKLTTPPINAFDHVYLADGETHRLTFSVHHAVTERLELGVDVPISAIGGGFQDALVEKFHDAFGLGRNARWSLTRNSETIYLASGTMHFFRDGSSGAQLGDIALTTKYLLSQPSNDRVAYAIACGVEVPTGSAKSLAGSGSLDGGVQILTTRKMRFGVLNASLGVLLLGPDRPLGTKRATILTDTVGFTYLLTGATSVTVQLTTSPSPFRDSGYTELKRRSNQLSTGFEHRIGPRTSFHVAFIENLFTFENSADFGLAFGVSRTW
jgi:hypothetical protein